ncbi:plasmid mobilization protein [Streptomyces sp. H39-S7]|uniref:plasmid mobilization protein n=1 Tax=Streptomyces sp. H39-S7 TaxID=3004357 RepID=UPI0022AFC412|nr:plasmid mobilization relaxosome protein MobC [Streptomyces sp. H39-S7]MCZ4120814.1 plasmid mobilization relaxosome protein MobC [Streptomyces sp. H39-S7]
MREINSRNTSTSVPHSGVEVTDAPVPTTCGASKSLRPPYGRSQAQAPAQGGGDGPAGAPGLEVVAAEGSRDQDPQPPSQRTATCQQPPVVRASAAAAARRKPKRRQRDAAQKKKSRVTVRFDQHEKQQLDEQAATAGLSLAHLVARRALTPGTATATAGSVQRTEQLDAAIDELASTRAELSAWGNNLNQIARHLNTGGTLVPSPATQFLETAGHLLVQDLPRAVALLDEAAHGIAKRRGRG